ncbi:MAG: hypothetical protein USCAAHI_01264 [Beijerinckiaceae bacterium]|nr:MAG: hypothetical protein USCAAHI_01264 [Beijerinckiaceae bacterium]
MLAHSCRFGLEGIISKRKDLPYRPCRSEHWLKAKCMHGKEFVILGYIASKAASSAVGSLPLGYYSEGSSFMPAASALAGPRIWQDRCA